MICRISSPFRSSSILRDENETQVKQLTLRQARRREARGDPGEKLRSRSTERVNVHGGLMLSIWMMSSDCAELRMYHQDIEECQTTEYTRTPRRDEIPDIHLITTKMSDN